MYILPSSKHIFIALTLQGKGLTMQNYMTSISFSAFTESKYHMLISYN